MKIQSNDKYIVSVIVEEVFRHRTEFIVGTNQTLELDGDMATVRADTGNVINKQQFIRVEIMPREKSDETVG